MLTALDSEADAVLGLEAGGDDYVTKPFGLAELRSRIRAVLRRAGTRAMGDEVLTVGPILLDRAQREVTIDGRAVRLTFSEFELLDALMAEPGRLLNRQELLRAIWGDSAYRDPRAIDVHIRHLREKLEPEPEKPRYILTVRGAGYRLRGQVTEPTGSLDRPRPLRAMLSRSWLGALGLRGRIVGAVLVTAVTMLVVAAIALLPRLERSLRKSAQQTLNTELSRAAISTRFAASICGDLPAGVPADPGYPQPRPRSSALSEAETTLKGEVGADQRDPDRVHRQLRSRAAAVLEADRHRAEVRGSRRGRDRVAVALGQASGIIDDRRHVVRARGDPVPQQ